MPADLYDVNSDTNKQWMFRLKLVEELGEWVNAHLNPHHAKWEESKADKKATPEGRRAKSLQYVYEFLAVGKMHFPMEDHDVSDPLFTSTFFVDKSMELQLEQGSYEHFISEVARKRGELRAYDPSLDPVVSWSDIQTGMSEGTKEMLARMHHDLLLKGHVVNMADEEMTGLVLRYKCMGAFSDNLHGSVPREWLRILGSDCVECFASPFNHKFRIYYSIYEQDRVFGSQGNFFAMMARRKDTLPEGTYEINPPWNNEMYERVQVILAKTLSNKQKIRAVIVGPNWKDTTWIPGITSVLNINRDYSITSKYGTRVVKYVNDMQAKTFTQNSVYWFFSVKPVTQETLELLKLVEPKRGAGNPDPKGKGAQGGHQAARKPSSMRDDLLATCPYTYSMLYA